MDDRRRTILAIGLLIIVAFLPSVFFRGQSAPAGTPPVPPVTPGDRTGVVDTVTVAPTAPALPPPPAIVSAPEGPDSAPNGGEEVVHVRSGIYDYGFSTRGARLVSASLSEYASLNPNRPGAAQIIPTEISDFLALALVIGNDTVPFADWEFTPSAELTEVTGSGASLSWEARRNGATVQLTYAFTPEQYLIGVNGRITGLTPGAGLLLVAMGPHLRSVEADTVEDQRAYGIVTKARNTENTKFSSLDPGERVALVGPFEWVAMKSKYFLTAVMAIEEGQVPFGGVLAIGGPKEGRVETNANVLASLPLTTGTFSYSVYVGPQEYRRLARIGHDFEDANPYGWSIFRAIIGPVSVFVVKALLWFHENLNMGYGWILILFGFLVRAALWPFQQKALRSQMALQALQPELEAIRKRHAGDQQRIGQETMRMYKENKVNPLGGCLPMLLPFPILIAFFFVFLNTIELRGVSFWWLPDLSRPDPFYIIPLLMGASMFALSKLGQLGVPPNPQAKMMLYVMPVVFTALFLRFASGLNLYYASQNIASLPQQWLIARERLKKQGKA